MTADEYLRQKFGASRAHPDWRDLKAAFEAGQVSVATTAAQSPNAQDVVSAIEEAAKICEARTIPICYDEWHRGWNASVRICADFVRTLATQPPQVSGQAPASTLAACPFDGGACVVTKGYSTAALPWSDDGGDFFRVYCSKCQSRQLFHRTEVEAVETWNRRAHPLTAQVAERQPLTGWINVEDRLPANRFLVLAYRPDADESPACDPNHRLCSYQDGKWDGSHHVSHWMPLPEAPASGEAKSHE